MSHRIFEVNTWALIFFHLTVLRITLSPMDNLKWTSHYVYWFTKFSSNTNHPYFVQQQEIITKILPSERYFFSWIPWSYARLGLLDIWRFIFQLPQIFWNISTLFLDIGFYVQFLLFADFLNVMCCTIWYQIAQSILNYFDIILISLYNLANY